MTAPDTTRHPDVPHPSTFIAEEAAARGWSMDRLAVEMGGDFGVNRLSLDFYFEVGTANPNLLLGADTADMLARAFGTSAEVWRNLHTAWRRSLVKEVA